MRGRTKHEDTKQAQRAQRRRERGNFLCIPWCSLCLLGVLVFNLFRFEKISKTCLKCANIRRGSRISFSKGRLNPAGQTFEATTFTTLRGSCSRTDRCPNARRPRQGGSRNPRIPLPWSPCGMRQAVGYLPRPASRAVPVCGAMKVGIACARDIHLDLPGAFRSPVSHRRRRAFLLPRRAGWRPKAGQIGLVA